MRRLALAVITVSSCLAMFACGGGSGSSNVSTPGGGGGGGGGGGTLPSGSIQPTFFALNMGPSNPWPTTLDINFGIWRSLGAQVRWSDLEPTCDGGTDPTNACYDWSTFDRYAALATTNGQDILFTAYYTPPWASSNPSAECQNSHPGAPSLGGCYPPFDVETGDQSWKNFLTALYTHAANTSGLEKIKYWECWNEPNVQSEYAGSLADLNQLCQDLRSTIKGLDPGGTELFTTPAPALDTGVVTWLQSWIGAGYDSSADIIAFHSYVHNDIPEKILSDILQPLATVVPSNKPLWDTEGSDDLGNQPLTDPDQHAAYYARAALLQQSENVAVYAYWGYDFGNGISLVDNPGTSEATPNEAGIAWQQIYSWTVGSKYTSACANSAGTVWQCGMTNLNGASTLVVWDTGQTCSAGVCTTSNFTAPSSFTTYTDLAGNKTNISGGVVPIGIKPVLLQ